MQHYPGTDGYRTQRAHERVRFIAMAFKVTFFCLVALMIALQFS